MFSLKRTPLHSCLLVAEEAVAGHTAVVAGHIVGVVAVEAADHTVAAAAAAVHTDHTVTSPLVVAAVVAAAVVVGSSQVGSSFVLGYNYCLHLLSHLQSFP